MDLRSPPFARSFCLGTLTLAGITFAGAIACGPQKPAVDPEEFDAPPSSQAPRRDGGAKTSDKSGDDDERIDPNACTGLAMDLANDLAKAACEGAKAPEAMEPKGLVEVKIIANPPKVAPGGHVDVTVIYTNKGKGLLPLSFVVNPLPRFELEAYDAKGNRVDNPPGEAPGVVPSAAPQDDRYATIKLAENGTAKITMGWDAAKMRWAPEKLKGAALGSKFPRSPAGPLPKGKYTLRLATPLVGITEEDRAFSAPKVEIEVAK
jgi:hypothetical protein